MVSLMADEDSEDATKKSLTEARSGLCPVQSCFHPNEDDLCTELICTCGACQQTTNNKLIETTDKQVHPLTMQFFDKESHKNHYKPGHRHVDTRHQIETNEDHKQKFSNEHIKH